MHHRIAKSIRVVGRDIKFLPVDNFHDWALWCKSTGMNYNMHGWLFLQILRNRLILMNKWFAGCGKRRASQKLKWGACLQLYYKITAENKICFRFQRSPGAAFGGHSLKKNQNHGCITPISLANNAKYNYFSDVDVVDYFMMRLWKFSGFSWRQTWLVSRVILRVSCLFHFVLPTVRASIKQAIFVQIMACRLFGEIH